VEGVDSVPRDMTDAEMRALNDPWATTVLRKGIFPKDIVEILAALKPLEQQAAGRLERFSFLVGEGGQIPASSAGPEQLNRSFRYVVSWRSTATSEGDVFVSIPAGSRAGVNELIAWDQVKQGFNFYRRMDPNFWVWRGDTSLASDPGARGQGCFACHPHGTL